MEAETKTTWHSDDYINDASISVLPTTKLAAVWHNCTTICSRYGLQATVIIYQGTDGQLNVRNDTSGNWVDSYQISAQEAVPGSGLSIVRPSNGPEITGELELYYMLSDGGVQGINWSPGQYNNNNQWRQGKLGKKLFAF